MKKGAVNNMNSNRKTKHRAASSPSVSSAGAVLLLICLVVIYGSFLFYRVSSFPNVFLDEGNCMYDSWCMAFYGVDSNLLKNPVYLPGSAGQGQSILYAKLAGIFMRLMGYNLLAYRMPIILISILNYFLIILLAVRIGGVKNAVLPAIVVGSSPWLLTISRWGMDCNIAPFIASIGIIVLFCGFEMKRSRRRSAVIILGAFLLGMVTYSYNVGWMFLPLFLFVLVLWLLIAGKIKIRELIVPGCILFVTVLPIMIFAVRSNVPDLNKDIQILWWTSPRLSVGRVKASFISFDGNIAVNIVHNLLKGIKIYMNGSDGLSWNSVGNIGPYYMFALPFFLFGLFTMLRRRSDADIFVLSQLIAMIPIMMLVTPNFNHWIFVHFPALLTISVGMQTIAGGLKSAALRRSYAAAAAITYLLFSAWFGWQYFHLDRFTGWETDAVAALQSLHTDQYSKVYFDSKNENFLYFVRFSLPVSPYEYQETRDHPYSKTELGTKEHYVNFERISEGVKTDSDALFIVERSLSDNYSSLTEGKEPAESFVLRSEEYDVYVIR